MNHNNTEKSPIETASAKYPISQMETNCLHTQPIAFASSGISMINTTRLENAKDGVVTRSRGVVKQMKTKDVSASVNDEITVALAMLELKQKNRAEAKCLKRHREQQDIKIVQKKLDRVQSLHVRWVAKCTKRALSPVNEEDIDIAKPRQIIIPLKKDEWVIAQANMRQAEYSRRQATMKYNQRIRDRQIEKERMEEMTDIWARERRTQQCSDAVFVKRHPQYSNDVHQLKEWLEIAKRKQKACDDRFEAIRKRRAFSQLRGIAKTLARKVNTNAQVQENRQSKRDEKAQKYDLHAAEEHDDLKAFDGKPLYTVSVKTNYYYGFGQNCDISNDLQEYHHRRDAIDAAAIQKYKDDAAEYVRLMADSGMPYEAIQIVVQMTYPYAFGTMMDWMRIFQPLQVQSGANASFVDLFEQYKKDYAPGMQDKSLLYWMEMIVDYVYMMSTTTNTIHVMICMKRLLQEISGVSVLDTIVTWIETLFVKPGLSTQAGEENKLHWWATMRKWISDGAQAITCEMFQKFSKIIACIAALGMCRAYKAHFTIQAFEKFYAASEHRKSDPISIWVSVLTAIKEFCERGYAWFVGDATTAELFGVRQNTYADEMAIVLGCIAALEAGQIDRIKSPSGEWLTEEEYMVMLDRCQEKTKALGQYAVDAERRLLDQKRIELTRIQTRVVAYRNRMGLRKAPFAYMLHGDSATGKTGLAPYLTRAIAKHNGIYHGEEATWYMNPHDKYDTNAYSFTTCISAGDAGTVKPEWEEGSMNDKLMRIIDNQPITALKADVDSKGKIYIAPSIVDITTNVKNLDAHVKMSEPIALMRRIPVHIEVKLKDEYKQANRPLLDSSKFKDGLNDAWIFDVRQVLPLPNPMRKLPSPMDMMFISDEHGPMQSIGVDRLIKYLCSASEKHFAHQEKILINQAKIFKLDLCSHNSFRDVCSDCKELSLQSGDEYARMRLRKQMVKDHASWHESQIPDFLRYEVKQYNLEQQLIRETAASYVAERYAQHEREESAKLAREVKRNSTRDLQTQAGEENVWDMPVHNMVMTDEDAQLFAVMRTKQYYLSRLIPTWAYQIAVDPVYYLRYHTLDWKQWICVSMFVFCVLAVMKSSVVLAAVTWSMFGLIAYVAYEARRLSATIKRTSNSSLKFIAPLIANKKYVAVGCCVGLAATIGSLIVLVRAWERNKTTSFEAGIIAGKSCDRCSIEIPYPDILCHACLHAANKIDTQGGNASIPVDKVQREDTWLNPTCYKPRCCHKLATSTHAQVLEGMARRMATGMFHDSATNTDKRCDVIPYKGNVWIIPYHIAKQGYRKVDIVRDKGMLNNSRTCCISEQCWVRIPGVDLALITLPEAGNINDYSDFFPDEMYLGEKPVTWIYKDRDVDVHTEQCTVRFKEQNFTCNGDRYMYSGYTYHLERNTVQGMCMAPLISRGKVSHIIGFHLAGVTGSTEGVAAAVTKDMFDAAYKKLFGDRASINIQVHSEGVMQLENVEHGIKLTGEIHAKSPFKFMEKNGTVECYGSHNKTRSFISRVSKSHISDAVAQITGVDCTHGKPMGMNSAFPWREDAIKAIDVSDINHEYLIDAFHDIVRAHDGVMDAHPEGKEYIKKLTIIEAISGLDGVRGIDAMKKMTSCGFPGGGPKSVHLFPVEEEVPGITCPYDMSAEYQQKFKVLIDTLAREERAYVIHQMHLKDEPTVKGKTKVRVFAGCPMEFLVAMKMYFGGVLKFIMENMFEFETAVGINATSPEWDDAYKYVSQYGDKHINGDFKAFDIKSAMTLILLSFKLMINIAEWSGNFNEYDITIMRGLASELASPLCEYNGEFVMWYMRNLSGHGATVNINGFVNSLLMRYAYYMLWNKFRNVDSLWIQGFRLANPQTEILVNSWIEQAAQCGGTPGDFNKAVALLTYGDDNDASVKEGYGWFNHTTVAYALTSIGVTYTMADKTATSVPYLRKQQISFLKRKFKYNAYLWQHMAPLEEASLYKTLHANLASKFVTPEQQSVEAINGVLRELFQHGRYIYDEWRGNLERVITLENMWGNWYNRKLPTYDDFLEQYIQKYLTGPDSSGRFAKNELHVLVYDSDGCEMLSGSEYACVDEGVS